MKLSRRIILNLSTIVKPCQKKVYQQGNKYCLYDSAQIDDFNPEMLSARFWQQQNAVTGTAQGRGTTYFVQSASQQQWVLRHYYRGGLVGKLIDDSYLFFRQERTRAVEEFNLLQHMTELGLPVPAPIACRIEKKGLLYRADLLTGRIVNAKDLVALLAEKPLRQEVWLNIGRTIQAFHQQGIYHHDLNAHNILLDDTDKVWLIDFDRGQQRKPEQSWQQKNIDRLLRSFHKEQHLLANFHWQADDWQVLMEGYLS